MQNESEEPPLSNSVWPPPPDNQEETAAKQGAPSVERKPNYPLTVLHGMGLNLVAYWFLLIAGNVFFPRKIHTSHPDAHSFFWTDWGLALAINIIGFVLVPKNKRYSAYLIVGGVLMSLVSWWFDYITDLAI